MRSAKPRPMKRTGRRGMLAATTAALTALAGLDGCGTRGRAAATAPRRGAGVDRGMGHGHAAARRGQRGLGAQLVTAGVRRPVRTPSGPRRNRRIRVEDPAVQLVRHHAAADHCRDRRPVRRRRPGLAGHGRTVTFGGSRGATIAPGRDLVSDAEGLSTSPLEKLTVTLYFAGRTGPATFHRFTTAASYRAPDANCPIREVTCSGVHPRVVLPERCGGVRRRLPAARHRGRLW